MTVFLAVSGTLFWILLLWYFADRLRGHPAVKRWLDRPALYPYAQFFEQKYNGLLMLFWRMIGVGSFTVDYIRTVRAVKLGQMKQLRDAYLKLDELPTIQMGNESLGLKSALENQSKRTWLTPSSYTHPLQRPPFFLPGVPARTFYDPSEFEWAPKLEEAYPVIKEELMNLLHDDGAGFQSYVSEYAFTLAGWNTFNFFFFGKKFEENCTRCPKTTEILESLPRFEKDHIMFSALNPHSAIPPHYGPMNGIMRAHLPLIVPEGCYIKVGENERTWEEGKLMVFDDSFLHQVWNHSDHLRIVLFLNFWHPCFSAEEIPVLEEFRKAYENHPVAQQHAHKQGEKRAHDIVREQPQMPLPRNPNPKLLLRRRRARQSTGAAPRL